MKTVRRCTSKNGSLRGYSTTIVSSPGEFYRQTNAFDTVVSVNAIEHVQDALEFLYNIYTSLKRNGTLIWHERWNPVPKHGQKYQQIHPIHISRLVVDKFLMGLEPPYKTYFSCN